MPTYEYACPQGHEFELFQKMSDKPRARCPVCGKLAVRKISGGAGLHFKGSGFYITDYGKDGKGPRDDKASEAPDAAKPGAATPAAADAATKPDSKPAGAATAKAAADQPAKAEKPAKKAKS
jgi:putative FmdB family regulatory protein